MLLINLVTLQKTFIYQLAVSPIHWMQLLATFDQLTYMVWSQAAERRKKIGKFNAENTIFD